MHGGHIIPALIFVNNYFPDAMWRGGGIIPNKYIGIKIYILKTMNPHNLRFELSTLQTFPILFCPLNKQVRVYRLFSPR